MSTQPTIGHYQLLGDPIGRGGFAAVYRARDTRLDRVVALKVLHPWISQDPELMQRFQGEGRAAARLRHPHIVTIYDVGQADGQLYIAMELLDGGDLNRLLKERGPLPLEEALPLLAQIAGALDYAHGQGVVHRDLKPANILLERPEWQPDATQTRLSDFGLVRLLSESAVMSSAGKLAGSPEYMAPEQCDPNRAEEVGPASDRYALGVVAYQMLTGRAPFPGSTPATINAHLNLAPPDPARYAAHLPEGVAPALLTALAKEPDQRFPSCGAFVAALQEALDAERRAEEAAQAAARRKAEEEAAAAVAAERRKLEVQLAAEREKRLEQERLLKEERERMAAQKQQADEAARAEARSQAEEEATAAVEAERRKLEAQLAAEWEKRLEQERLLKEERERLAAQNRQAEEATRNAAAEREKRLVQERKTVPALQAGPAVAAPETKTERPAPLRVWNPLDHLRLLWWIFFAPQRAKAYVAAYGDKAIEPVGNWLGSWLLWLPPLLPNLALGLGVLPLAEGSWSSPIHFWLSAGMVWAMLMTKWFDSPTFGELPGWLQIAAYVGVMVVGVACGVAGGVVVDVAVGVVVGVAGFLVIGVAVGVAGFFVIGMAGAVVIGVAGSVAGVVMSSLAGGVAVAVGIVVMIGVAGGVVDKVSDRIFWAILLGLPALVMGVVVFIMTGSVTSGLLAGVLGGVGWVLAFFLFAVIGTSLEEAIKNGRSSWFTVLCGLVLLAANAFLLWYCFLGGWRWFGAG